MPHNDPKLWYIQHRAPPFNSGHIAGKAQLLHAHLPVAGLANRAALRHDEGAQGHPVRARRASLAARGVAATDRGRGWTLPKRPR